MIPDWKLRIAGALCAPWIGRLVRWVFGGKIPSRGVWVACASPWVGTKSVAMLFWNMYESAEARLIKQHLPTDQPVIELGASLGFVSSLIGSRLNKGVLGLSLEANPNLIPVINATLSLNHLANMRVRNLAINYDGQPGVLFNVATDNLVSRLSEESNGTAVEATTLSNLLDELKWQRYTLVSDIEGAEAGFLLADAGALQMCQTVIIELHATHFRGNDYTIDDLGAILVKQHNFQWVDRDGAVAVFKKASSCAE